VWEGSDILHDFDSSGLGNASYFHVLSNNWDSTIELTGLVEHRKGESELMAYLRLGRSVLSFEEQIA
jgi:hypothetical protein